eukprot:jgi/Picsp_1/1948/NSC_05414-R1_tubulin-specific chaperone c
MTQTIETLARRAVSIHESLVDESNTFDVCKCFSDIKDLEDDIAIESHAMAPYDLRQLSEKCKLLRKKLATITKATSARRSKFSFRNLPKDVVASQNKVDEISGASGENAKKEEMDLSSKSKPTADNVICLENRKDEIIRIHTGGKKAMYINNVESCVIVCDAAVDGAAHVDRALNCVMYIEARQVRIHNAENCTFYVKVLSGPIIEDSNGIKFAPLDSEEIGGKDAGGLCHKWSQVQDFGWLKQNIASPHWSVLSPEERNYSLKAP